MVQEMILSAEFKLQFGGIHFRPSILLINCVTQETAVWLRAKTPSLSTWKGPELMVCLRDESSFPGEDTYPSQHTRTWGFAPSCGEY